MCWQTWDCRPYADLHKVWLHLIHDWERNSDWSNHHHMPVAIFAVNQNHMRYRQVEKCWKIRVSRKFTLGANLRLMHTKQTRNRCTATCISVQASAQRLSVVCIFYPLQNRAWWRNKHCKLQKSCSDFLTFFTLFNKRALMDGNKIVVTQSWTLS